MRALVLGLGSIGMRHARNLRTLGIEALSGFDPTPERRERFAQKLGGVVFDDLDQALDARPDLVIVASPNVFHLAQADRALDAGVPALLIEKPLGTDLEHARRFVRRAAETDAFIHGGSNWKYHPAFETMKKLLDEKALGKVTAVQVLAGQWLPDWHPWEDYRAGYSARHDLGGGAIFDTHELDYITWLFGPADRFAGMHGNRAGLEISTEDTAVALVSFTNGVLGVLQTDYVQRTPQRRYVITGSKGTLTWTLAENAITITRQRDVAPERIDVAADDLNDMYVAQSRDVLARIRDGRSPTTPVSHMLHVLELQHRWHTQAGAAMIDDPTAGLAAPAPARLRA
ncbi:MAG: Gfo/Idh/MocA family oxidoreductase [Pseudomonadota bacterium]